MLKRRATRRSHSAEESLGAIRYLVGMIDELELIAKHDKLDFLAYLLSLARLEASVAELEARTNIKAIPAIQRKISRTVPPPRDKDGQV